MPVENDCVTTSRPPIIRRAAVFFQPGSAASATRESRRALDGRPSGVFLETAEDPFLAAFERDQETGAGIRRMFEQY